MLKAFTAAAVLLTAPAVFAADGNFAAPKYAPSPYVITVETVSLKNEAGKWVKIIEPDRRVDLSKEEPALNFFNNGGRIPAGNYVNFRVDFLDGDSNLKRFSSRRDFEKGVPVHKGSFVRVAFGLDLGPKIGVDKAELAVDDDARDFSSEALSLEKVPAGEKTA